MFPLVELCLIALLLAARCSSQSLTANRILGRQDGNGQAMRRHHDQVRVVNDWRSPKVQRTDGQISPPS
jgi:hypothetical protein